MRIFPAIDLYDGCAVRLYRGDYDQMTIYSHDPGEFAAAFEEKGASYLHLVDLQGARDGGTPNLNTIRDITAGTGLFTELGGGIRSLETIDKYLNIGVDRVILGTAAITEEGFVEKAIRTFGSSAIAAGVDIAGGNVAIRGWREVTETTCDEFCARMESAGVKTIICTDISKDGAMEGTNRNLYADLSRKFSMDITASGGISTADDVRALAELGLYGAILGKALYEGAIDLADAIAAAESAEHDKEARVL